MLISNNSQSVGFKGAIKFTPEASSSFQRLFDMYYAPKATLAFDMFDKQGNHLGRKYKFNNQVIEQQAREFCDRNKQPYIPFEKHDMTLDEFMKF
ncbi:MAG: hypothetical protein WCF95_03460 [bacterium]